MIQTVIINKVPQNIHTYKFLVQDILLIYPNFNSLIAIKESISDLSKYHNINQESFSALSNEVENMLPNKLKSAEELNEKNRVKESIDLLNSIFDNLIVPFLDQINDHLERKITYILIIKELSKAWELSFDYLMERRLNASTYFSFSV
jgi:predicted transcriptional regulator